MRMSVCLNPACVVGLVCVVMNIWIRTSARTRPRHECRDVYYANPTIWGRILRQGPNLPTNIRTRQLERLHVYVAANEGHSIAAWLGARWFATHSNLRSIVQRVKGSFAMRLQESEGNMERWRVRKVRGQLRRGEIGGEKGVIETLCSP